MKELVLTEEETKKIKERDAVLVTRNDFVILVERFKALDEYIYKTTLISPYEIKLFEG